MLKPTLTLAALFALIYLTPIAPVDPWDLLSPRKIATMIFALALVQVLGVALGRLLGARAGVLVTGFLGGLISSTATTASVAKRSRRAGRQDATAEMLTFLAATAAMLLEGAVLTLTGNSGIHASLLLLFLGPLVATGLMIAYQSRKFHGGNRAHDSTEFEVLPILKTAAFVAGVLALSKILQNVFGQSGLMVLTFLVSLFEIHGSVIANLQLHDSGAIGVVLLGGLLALSIIASYISKLFLIYTLGSARLKAAATKSTIPLLVSLLASWGVFLLASEI